MATYEACYSAGWSSRSVTQAAAFPLSLSLSLFSTSSCFSAKTLKMIVSPYGCILVVFCFFWKNWSCVPKCIPFPFYVSQTCLFECWKCYLVCFTLDCVYVFVVLQCVLLSCFSFYFFHFVEGVKEVARRWDRKDSAYDCASNDWRNVRSRLRDQLPTAFRVSSLLGKETITERGFFFSMNSRFAPVKVLFSVFFFLFKCVHLHITWCVNIYTYLNLHPLQLLLISSVDSLHVHGGWVPWLFFFFSPRCILLFVFIFIVFDFTLEWASLWVGVCTFLVCVVLFCFFSYVFFFKLRNPCCH